MLVQRADLLNCLEVASGAVASREVLEQSSCFAFSGGEVLTFDGEMAVRARTPLEAAFTGAVKAKTLLAIVKSLPDDEVDVEFTDSELLLKGKNGKRRGRWTLEKEITLPVSGVEAPGKWQKLPEGFTEAVAIVKEVVGTDKSKIATTCVHIAPHFMESTDRFQIVRVALETGLKESVWVRGEVLGKIAHLGVTKWSITPGWVHFRTPGRTVFSCLRFVGVDYPDLGQFLQVSGEPTTLPPDLEEVAGRCENFSQENPDFNMVRVDLKPSRITVAGVGASGSWEEDKKVRYRGQALTFLISPKLLVELPKKKNECLVGEGRLKVDGGKWQYVTMLHTPPNSNGHAAASDSSADGRSTVDGDDEG